MLQEIIDLRHNLHRHPELSGEEANTARKIKEFIQRVSDAEILTQIGGNGLMVIYKFGTKKGPTIVFRCELDALPIKEINDFEHQSQFPGISHKCGHDGHISIMAGLAIWLEKQNFHQGQVILLFQPSEENGMGAQAILDDPRFNDFCPDYLYALHNIPGYPLHSIITKEDIFTPSVISFSANLIGKEAHASEPENGINPSLAISEIVQVLEKLNTHEHDEDFKLLTPVYLQMGKKAYGISAGQGAIHYTIRTWSEEVMTKLKSRIKTELDLICSRYQLQHSVCWFEQFPSVINDSHCNNWIKKAAVVNQLQLIENSVPFKFGEDFGWFAHKYKAAMFGLGAGVNCPSLHHADYDFPDELLATGIAMFSAIISGILESHD